MRLVDLKLNPGETLTISVSGDGLSATVKLADQKFDSEVRIQTRAEQDNATLLDGCLEFVRGAIDVRHQRQLDASKAVRGFLGID